MLHHRFVHAVANAALVAVAIVRARIVLRVTEVTHRTAIVSARPPRWRAVSTRSTIRIETARTRDHRSDAMVCTRVLRIGSALAHRTVRTIGIGEARVVRALLSDARVLTATVFSLRAIGVLIARLRKTRIERHSSIGHRRARIRDTRRPHVVAHHGRGSVHLRRMRSERARPSTTFEQSDERERSDRRSDDVLVHGVSHRAGTTPCTFLRTFRSFYPDPRVMAAKDRGTAQSDFKYSTRSFSSLSARPKANCML
jgi:hypothetical protein